MISFMVNKLQKTYYIHVLEVTNKSFKYTFKATLGNPFQGRNYIYKPQRNERTQGFEEIFIF